MKKKKVGLICLAGFLCLTLVAGTIFTISNLKKSDTTQYVTQDEVDDGPLVLKTTNIKAKKISDTQYQLTATVYPEYNFNKNVTWTLAWKDATSTFAKGKTVTSYVKMTEDEDDETVVLLDLVAAFGEQIIVTCASTDYPNINASCTIDYEKKVTGITFNPNSTTPSSSYIIDGDKLGSNYTVSYSPIYTLDNEFTNLSLKVDIGIPGKDYGVYVTSYNSNGLTINYKMVMKYLTTLIDNDKSFSTTTLMTIIKNDADSDIFTGSESNQDKEGFVAKLKTQKFNFRARLFQEDTCLATLEKQMQLKLKDVTSISLSDTQIIY